MKVKLTYDKEEKDDDPHSNHDQSWYNKSPSPAGQKMVTRTVTYRTSTKLHVAHHGFPGSDHTEGTNDPMMFPTEV